MSTLVDDPVLVAFAGEVGATGPVAVEGGRTRWSHCGAPDDGTRLVRAPTGIVEHRPEEMTVRVRAGTTVSELHEALAAAGQRSALPERGGTVGGALAVGENDLHCLGRGRLRAALLQVRYVSAEGVLVTGGGPTVKNVTGFDLPRLMVGAYGTLGLLAEAIVRTNPLPAVSCWLQSTDADPFAARDVLLRPSVVLWDGTTTWVQLEGHEPDVVSETIALGTVGTFTTNGDLPPLPPHRWSLRPSDLATLDRHALGSFVASIGVGNVFASHPQPRRELDPAALALSHRLKAEFDPTGRLNPGRHPWSQ